MKKKKQEKIYDEKISPLMTEIIKICKEHEITIFSLFQYDKTEFCKTYIPNEPHMLFNLINIMHQCIEEKGVNIDKFLFSIMRLYPNTSSMCLHQLGHKVDSLTTQSQ